MASVRKSLILSFAGKYTELAIQAVAIMILARLLTPTEIGIASVASAFVALAHMLRDFGIASYIVQEKELTKERLRTAFGIMLAIAWVMAVVLFALSGPVSRFYNEPGVREVIMVLSCTFLVIPLGAPVVAVLRRQMDFGGLLRIGIVGALVGQTTSIILAALGFGYMSVPWGALAWVLTTAVAAHALFPDIARLLPSFREWRRVLSFGSVMSAGTLVSELGVQAPDLILGRFLGFSAVAFYNRAMSAISFFNQGIMAAVMPVALSDFAAKYRAGEELKTGYLNGVTYVTGVAWPFFGFVALLAYPIIRILFGPQWDEAVPLVPILCVAASINALINLSGNLLVAMGEVKKNLKTQLIVQSFRILLILGASFHGLIAVAGSQILVYVASFFVSYYFLSRLIGLSMADIVRAVYKSAGVALISLTVPVLILFLMERGPKDLWTPLVLSGASAVVTWVLAVLLLNHPIKQEFVHLVRTTKQAMFAITARERQ